MIAERFPPYTGRDPRPDHRPLTHAVEHVIDGEEEIRQSCADGISAMTPATRMPNYVARVATFRLRSGGLVISVRVSQKAKKSAPLLSDIRACHFQESRAPVHAEEPGGRGLKAFTTR
jgi:hypothetical protein